MVTKDSVLCLMWDAKYKPLTEDSSWEASCSAAEKKKSVVRKIKYLTKTRYYEAWYIYIICHWCLLSIQPFKPLIQELLRNELQVMAKLNFVAIIVHKKRNVLSLKMSWTEYFRPHLIVCISTTHLMSP